MLFTNNIQRIIQLPITMGKKGIPKKEEKRLSTEVLAKDKTDMIKYDDILKSDLDPVDYQKSMRNEWEKG
jgi:hypothetical protein